MLKSKSGPTPEKLLLRKVVFEGKLLKVRVDTVLAANGRRSTREVVETHDSIGVVVVDAEDNILLVNQYRTPPAKNLLEIPAGGIDKGEDVETAVIREMQEETGFKPSKVTRLCGFYLSPGFCSEYMHIYLAMNLSASPLAADDTAGIELVKVPAKEVPDLITSGRIQDSKSMAALLFYLKFKG